MSKWMLVLMSWLYSIHPGYTDQMVRFAVTEQTKSDAEQLVDVAAYLRNLHYRLDHDDAYGNDDTLLDHALTLERIAHSLQR